MNTAISKIMNHKVNYMEQVAIFFFSFLLLTIPIASIILTGLAMTQGIAILDALTETMQNAIHCGIGLAIFYTIFAVSLSKYYGHENLY